MFGLLCIALGTVLGRSVAREEQSDPNVRKRSLEARQAALEASAHDAIFRYLRRYGPPLSEPRRRQALAAVSHDVSKRTGASLVESASAVGKVGALLDGFTH